MRSFKKMGLLFMVLVIALAGLGVGFAAWTDKITIEGTVNTGSVCLEVTEYSETWVYKDLTNDGMVTLPAASQNSDYLYVASATARAGDVDEADVVLTWDNLFPGVDFTADFMIHYCGSVPAKIAWFNWVGDMVGDEELMGLMSYSATYDGKLGGGVSPGHEIGEPVDFGFQLHNCDQIYVEVTFRVPQEDLYMNLSGSGTMEMGVVQWNEWTYPYTPPTMP